ncbi:MAG TPA: aminotransferase class IV [Bryobacteraceae bacterium]|jgi:branched-chain amino acid aminotransferase|nr:aminotransferase class IV [Bryobacteraceae bacterium]
MSIHSHILWNGEIREATEACLVPGQVGLLAGWGVFSTLRIMDGALFAWDRHWARMSRDAILMNVPMPPSADGLQDDLLRLIAANGIENGTLRLVIVRNGGSVWEGPSTGRASDTIALTTGLKQWPASVRLSIQAAGRYAASDFTRAKILSWSENLRWAERAQEKGFDESLLLNEFGRVAECTSANIFAVKGGQVCTPPLSEGCLPGITREVLLGEIRVPGLSVVEKELRPEDLFEASEVFITSSTRDLLPVAEIDGRKLNRGDASERLVAEFRKFLRQDVAGRKSAAVPTR